MKKIIAGVVALTIAFGGLALPAAESGLAGAAVSASAEEMSEDYAANEEISPDDGETYIAEQSGEDVQVAGAILTYGDYNYTVLDDGTVEITNYIGDDSMVTMPTYINGKVVSSVGSYAFGESLTSVKLPEKLSIVKECAFANCTYLVSVAIPKSVKKIEFSAFYLELVKAVYYTGTEEEYNQMDTTMQNNPLSPYATWVNKHYNYDYSQPILDVKASEFDPLNKAIKYTWIPAPDADGYKIYVYNTSTKKWENKVTVRDGKATSCTIKNLKAGTEYDLRIRAYAKRNGKTYWGDYDRGSAITLAASPVIKSTSSTKNSITLKWGKVKSADGYRVYRYDSKTKKWKSIATVKNGKTSYVDKKSLKSKTTYKYKVKAYHKWGPDYNKVNVWGLASAVKSVKTK